MAHPMRHDSIAQNQIPFGAYEIPTVRVFDFKLSITDMDLMELLDQRAFLENHHTAAGLERILQLK